VDINATALKAAISGSIFADPDVCIVMVMALPFGSTRAFATADAISLCSHRPRFHPQCGLNHICKLPLHATIMRGLITSGVARVLCQHPKFSLATVPANIR
jgi:hypothetical protein